MLETIKKRIHEAIAEKSTHLDLSVLDFSVLKDSSAKSTEIIRLIQSLPPQIKSLSLASCQLGQIEGDELLRAIPEHIVDLDLRDNEIGCTHWFDHLHPHVKRLNCANNYLINNEKLDDHNTLGEFEKDVQILTGYLPKYIEFLDLSNNITETSIPQNNARVGGFGFFNKLALENVKTMLRVILHRIESREKLLYLKLIQFAENDIKKIDDLRNDDELQDLILNINPHLILKIGSVELRLEKAHFYKFKFYSAYSEIFDDADSEDIEDMLKILPTSVRSIVFSCKSTLKPQDEDLSKVFISYFRNNPNCVINFHGVRYTMDGPAIRMLVEGQYPAFIKVIGTKFTNPSSKKLYDSRNESLNQTKPAAAQEVILDDEHKVDGEPQNNSADMYIPDPDYKCSIL